MKGIRVRFIVVALAFGVLFLGGCTGLSGNKPSLVLNFNDEKAKIKINIGEIPPFLKIPTRVGYSFCGWSQNGKLLNMEQPLTSLQPLVAEFCADTDTSAGLMFERCEGGLRALGFAAGVEERDLVVPAFVPKNSAFIIDTRACAREAQSLTLGASQNNAGAGAKSLNCECLAVAEKDFGASQNNAEVGAESLNRESLAVAERDFGVSQNAVAERDFGASQNNAGAGAKSLKGECLAVAEKDFGASQNAVAEKDFGASQNNAEVGAESLNGECLAVVEIADGAFLGRVFDRVVLPKTLKVIGERAFEGAELPHLFLPSDLVEIKERAFWGIVGGRIFDVPSGVEHIAGSAFASAELEMFRTSGGKYSVKNSALCLETEVVAFPKLAKVRDLKIADDITKIGDYAFFGQYFQSIALGQATTTVGVGAFQNVVVKHFDLARVENFLENSLRNLITKTLLVPESAQVLGRLSFEGVAARRIVFCGKIDKAGEAGMPKAIIYGAESALLSLKSCFIGAKVVNVSALQKAEAVVVDGVVLDCADGLLSVKIAANVTQIATGALCREELCDIDFAGDLVQIDANALYPCNALKLRVPAGTLDAYRIKNPHYAAYFVEKEPELAPQCTVNFRIEGQNMEPKTVAKGEKFVLPTVEKVGYTFLGWSDGTKTYTAGAEIVVTENITLTAQFAIILCTVTFAGGDKTLPPQTVNYAEVITLPAVEKEGYTFLGWSDGTKTYMAGAEMLVTENITFTAQFAIILCTVTFAGGDKTLPPQTVNYAEGIILPAVEKVGYTFLGWSDGTKTYTAGAEIVVTENITLTAQFAIILCTVTFAGGDKTLPAQTVNYTEVITLPTVEKMGYTFLGWSDGVKTYMAGAEMLVTKNITFTAQYQIKSFEVRFMVDQKEVAVATVLYLQAPVLPTPPQKASSAEFDFVFEGWDKDLQQIAQNTQTNAVFAKIRRKYSVSITIGAQTEVRSIEYGSPVGTLLRSSEGKQIEKYITAEGTEIVAQTLVFGAMSVIAVFCQEQRDPYKCTEGLEFLYDATLNGYVVEYYFGTATEIEIPARFVGADGDCAVVAVGENVFSEKEISKIFLPEGLIEIRRGAFLFATGLSQIVLPKSLVKIESDAFSITEQLKAVTISGNNLTEVGDCTMCSADGTLTLFVESALQSLYAERFLGRDDLKIVTQI